MAFLSEEWFKAFSEAVASVSVEPSLELVVGQRVVEDANVTEYWLVCRDGACAVHRTSRPARVDVTLSTPRTVAESLVRGETSAAQEILHGTVQIDGDPNALLSAASLLSELGSALETLRAST